MTPIIWLASYPRSGNTMMRVVLAQCFGLPSAAIYREDLDGNRELQALTGRIAPSEEGVIDFGDAPVRVLKTHSPPQDASKAIYIVRNGIDAVASFHDHSGRRIPIPTLITGRPGLPSWSGHVAWWQPQVRPDTLLLRYEEIVADMSGTIDRIAHFLGLVPRARTIPSRDELASVDGKWIRSASAPGRTVLSDAQVEQFWQVNGPTMEAYGYARQPGDPSSMVAQPLRA
jgi:hypothetical protein